MINKFKNWKKIVVNNKLSIKQCLLKLNSIGSQILIVCSEKGILRGTITDGDIRRGLINGFKLNSNINLLGYFIKHNAVAITIVFTNIVISSN